MSGSNKAEPWFVLPFQFFLIRPETFREYVSRGRPQMIDESHGITWALMPDAVMTLPDGRDVYVLLAISEKPGDTFEYVTPVAKDTFQAMLSYKKQAEYRT